MADDTAPLWAIQGFAEDRVYAAGATIPGVAAHYSVGDTEPSIRDTLQQRNPETGEWEPIDLTGKTVILVATNMRTRRTFTGAATGDAEGRAEYALQDGDLSDAGSYRYVYKIAAEGRTRTAPRGSFLELEVSL